MVNSFRIDRNFCLNREVSGYFHQYYTGYGKEGNPDFVNILKNTFNGQGNHTITEARNKVVDILISDIPSVLKLENMSKAICVSVPRAKIEAYYEKNQLKFREAVKIASNNVDGVIDGSTYIMRTVDTFTTHLGSATRNGRIDIINEGSNPYPGISKDTCYFYKDGISNNNIILIDDIYTRTVNIDEDFIQALYDIGAKNVVFYAIGYTRR